MLPYLPALGTAREELERAINAREVRDIADRRWIERHRLYVQAKLLTRLRRFGLLRDSPAGGPTQSRQSPDAGHGA
jgi:hypothetical protein